ncbi:equilibrative nucleotide transporter 3-like isoform X2 [Canna indica]|uniref:Equilibrative nucleotide transporter 3-like isoform X2 n=1 Tax=Canna indica TaxID=4628 RepID=A0AAQ3L0K9_9LILI|nr:equilibrative nucleotide transporter 3-like isoform X2 [Canna indica]
MGTVGVMPEAEEKAAPVAKTEEEKAWGRDMHAVLDFDMLCTTVALQTQGLSAGKTRLKGAVAEEGGEEEEEEEEEEWEVGGVQRMWEGDVTNCFEDRRIAIEAVCCPCYRFGKNMGRANLGSCFLQGMVYFIFILTSLFNFIAFGVTSRHFHLYMGIASTISLGLYLGYFRTRMKKQFNIRGTETSLDGYANHLICPCCTLCQETRTLEMNNVQNGIWHGRSDAICLAGGGEGSNAFTALHKPPLFPTKSPDLCSMERAPDGKQITCTCRLNNSVLVRIAIWDSRLSEEYFLHSLGASFRSGWKQTSMGNQNENLEVPKGKFTAMVICWLLGNGALFCWNCMLTIVDYYLYLFPDYHPTRILTLVYQPIALITTAILTYREAKTNTRLRNITGYILFFVSSLVLIVLDLATSGKGGVGVYVGICIISAVWGLADGFVEGGMIGDLSLMCPEFVQSFLAGFAASGVLTSALRFITKAAFDNSRDGLRKGAILFFAISTAFELFCVLLYAFVFPKLAIVKYYRAKAATEGSLTVAADLVAAGVKTSDNQEVEEGRKVVDRLSTKQLIMDNLDYGIDLFLLYVLTLSIFPGFLSEDSGSHSLGSWYALVLIAMYNVTDLIGRYLPLIESIKMTSRKGLMLTILSRFLLVPAFYFTAKYGDQGWMIFLTSFLGLTNGYLTICVMAEPPKGYKGPEQNALGNALVFFLLSGIFSGVVLDWLWLIGKGW